MRRQRALRQADGAVQRTGRALWGAGILLMVLAGAATAGFALVYASLTAGLPSIQELPILLDPQQGLLLQPTVLFERSGQIPIYTVENAGVERRYLPLDPQQGASLSPQLVQAVISLFDPTFWQHGGYAAGNLLRDEPATLAERLVSDLLLQDEPRSARRAVRMRLLAAQVTARYGRERVLEWFMNSAYFGHQAYGAESAARLYLGKSASQLSMAEAALLAAALEAPALNLVDAAPAALEQQQEMLDRLLEAGVVSAAQREEERGAANSLPVPPAQPAGPAQAFSTLVLQQLSAQVGRNRLERGGLRIVTTLDLDLQAEVRCSLDLQLARLQGLPDEAPAACQSASRLPTLAFHPTSIAGGLSGSAVVLENSTGQVLAYVGDLTGGVESALLNRHPPGTLLTPFVALSAFAYGLSPATLVWDIPSPQQEPDKSEGYRGPLRLRNALVLDRLPPLQRILEQIEPSVVWAGAERLGLTGMGRQPGSSRLLFEGGETSVVQMAHAYGVFAAQGNLNGRADASSASGITPAAVLLVEDLNGRPLFTAGEPYSRSVLSQQLAYLVHHVLSDEPARWPGLGQGNALEIGRPAGAKIGTAAGGSQVWAAGYTPQLTSVVWLGAVNTGQVQVNLDRRAAAGVWHAVMQYASQNRPASGWTQPEGISTLMVCDPSGQLPTSACPLTVREVFLAGNEPLSGDTLYQVVRINRDTGRLATVFTAAALVEERTFMILPQEAQAWGRAAGLPVPPADYDLIQPPKPSPDAIISQPAGFSVVRGSVSILGSAMGEGFASYRVHMGAGLNPSSWVQIGSQGTSSVQNGPLATWQTPAGGGLYVLRLQVVRQNQQVETAFTQVTVDNDPPSVRFSTPRAGQVLKAGGEAVIFQAEASDEVGIQRVEFWINARIAGESTTTPYTLAWQPLPGRHNLVVKAYDLAGNSAASEALFITVE